MSHRFPASILNSPLVFTYCYSCYYYDISCYSLTMYDIRYPTLVPPAGHSGQVRYSAGHSGNQLVLPLQLPRLSLTGLASTPHLDIIDFIIIISCHLFIQTYSAALFWLYYYHSLFLLKHYLSSPVYPNSAFHWFSHKLILLSYYYFYIILSYPRYLPTYIIALISKSYFVLLGYYYFTKFQGFLKLSLFRSFAYYIIIFSILFYIIHYLYSLDSGITRFRKTIIILLLFYLSLYHPIFIQYPGFTRLMYRFPQKVILPILYYFRINQTPVIYIRFYIRIIY